MLSANTTVRKRIRWLLVFSVVLVAAGAEEAAEAKQPPAHLPPAHGLIRPGEGIDGVALGSAFSNFEAVFPKQPEFDEDYPDTPCGAGRVYHWLDLDRDATGVYVYLKHDQIYQISVQTPRFALSNGIKIDAPETQVRKAYPHGRGYVLLGSGSVAVGGRDLTYWVDQRQGVAFEFSWYQEKKQRFLRAIDVFRSGADFFPEGCISPPQQWRELTAESFTEIEAMVRHKSRVPTRLPSFLRSDYAIVKSATSKAYEILSGTVPDCQGQNYCLIGSVLGSTAPIQLVGRSSGVPVRLRGGIRGKFIAAECHAYCNQSYVTWSERGFYYAIGIKAGKKEELIRAADSAIPASH